MTLKTWTSPNFGDRAGGVKPSMLILHYTGMKTAEEALERLCDPSSQVSAHYVIGEDGTLHNLVPEERRAWHAGKSYWRGETDINSASIGIELVNPGHEFGYREFPEAQIKSTIALCKRLIEKYDIAPAHVLGHSDVAPARKIDPGELFPWEALAKQGIGIWPHPVEMDYQAAEDLVAKPGNFDELLCAYGYDPEVPVEDAVAAFHRHFYPEKILKTDPQAIDIVSFSRLLALLRAMHALSKT